MKVSRSCIHFIALSLLALASVASALNEIACEVKPLSEFWINEATGEFDQIIGCVFSTAASILDPQTLLSNTRNESVQKFEFSDASEMKFLPENISEVFPNLKDLKGYHSGLQSLTFNNLRQLFQLKEIDFRISQIEVIETNAFDDSTKLKEIYLTENKIKSLHENLFSKLKELLHLHLDKNEISRLDSKLLDNNKNLETLTVSRNKLEVIEPGTFDSLSNLNALWLSYNELTNLPASILVNNKKLATLYLNDNKFTTIDTNLLSGMSALNQISFSRNPLEIIDFEAFKDNKNMMQVYFEACKVKVIKNIAVVDSMENLARVHFGDNVCIDEDYDFRGLQFKLKRDTNRNCTLLE